MFSAGAPEHPRVTLYMGADKHESEMSSPCVRMRDREGSNATKIKAPTLIFCICYSMEYLFCSFYLCDGE